MIRNKGSQIVLFEITFIYGSGRPIKLNSQISVEGPSKRIELVVGLFRFFPAFGRGEHASRAASHPMGVERSRLSPRGHGTWEVSSVPRTGKPGRFMKATAER